jgi:beta-N-acetylhexosaminidase
MSGRKAVGEQTSLSDRKRRAAQRMILGFDGTSAPASLARFCKQAPPAGFILFARNVEEPAQVRELNRELAQLLPDALPALLSVDQEGGRVMRIKDTAWPPMRWLGNVDEVRLTRETARRMGLELAAMGFNLNWAPVADVDSNPKNPVIGDRSFSADPEVVARHCAAFLDGLHDAGLMGCIKHFPGHGDTATDSHHDLPAVDKDQGDLERCELLPFQSMVSAGVEMVMTAHVMFPVLDEAVPATMSHAILQGWLRERLGHSGLVVSDDMEMGAVRGRFALEQQLDLACRASVDLFLFCRDPALQMEAWETLIRLQEADPTHDTLATDSSRRLMFVREAHLLNPSALPMLASVGCQQHKDMARQIRDRGEA